VQGQGVSRSFWWNGMDGAKPLEGDRVAGSKIAEALTKLQDERNAALAKARDQELLGGIAKRYASIREQVAKQQSALLDELAVDAVAPLTEREKAEVRVKSAAVDADTFDSLARSVRWLMERGSNHAKQMARLQAMNSNLEKLVLQLQQRVFTLEQVNHGKLPVPYPAPDHGVSIDVSDWTMTLGPVTSVQDPVLQGKSVTMTVVDEVMPGCEHGINAKNTTVSAITRKKARCTVCAKVWELP
jgi:hypothetical protein